jgi:hypothetical protein
MPAGKRVRKRIAAQKNVKNLDDGVCVLETHVATVLRFLWET